MAGYMEQVQKYITEGMRTIIIEWLFEVAEDRRFVPETLFHTVSYINNTYAYETEPASLEYLCGKTLHSYTAEEATKMQSEVSIVIKDEMRNPTIISFLRYD
ncbi:putative cyclin [Helianthus anomalus]